MYDGGIAVVCGGARRWRHGDDTLSFVRDPSDPRGYTVQKRDDGVYIMTGMKIIVR